MNFRSLRNLNCRPVRRAPGACPIGLALLLILNACPGRSERPHLFGVRDDIGLAWFGGVAFSPRDDLMVVETERGSLRDGRLHEQLSVYSLPAIKRFVNRAGPSAAVRPLWVIHESAVGGAEGQAALTNIRWLSDESGFAFLLRTDPFHRRLWLAQIERKQVIPLSPEHANVLSYAIRSRHRYVFTLPSRSTVEAIQAKAGKPSRVGTGRTLYALAFPRRASEFVQRSDLWAALGGPPKLVTNRVTGKPVVLYEEGNFELSLSTDGRIVVTVQAVANVPREWMARFPAPYPSDSLRIRAGRQDLNAAFGGAYIGEYVAIDLADGATTVLTNAPAARRAGWLEVGAVRPAWSDDSSTVILPGTFVAGQGADGARPCIVAVQLHSRTAECVRPLKRDLANGEEAGYQLIDGIAFAPGRSERIKMWHRNHEDATGDSWRIYARLPSGTWRTARSGRGPLTHGGLVVQVHEDFQTPPRLIATDPLRARTRVVLDPNPQLKDVVFGAAEPYHWQDSSHRRWEAILYKPVGYRPGVRYPLVIQNHGFSVDRFLPSGGFPSAFAAQELASAGIVVLQMRDCAGRSTPLEGPCNVEGYQSAVERLSEAGLVDSSRVGIIGFSRTVFYVLEALTASKLQFRAASITDGITLGYMDYLTSVDQNRNYTEDQISIIGAQPFGSGLREWLRRSPDFNLIHMHCPLRVVARRGPGIFEMWEPYALLEAMHKPVDLIVLNTDEHVITDPAIRLVAQGGTVDWFRFWLQGYEDPNPGKRAQYRRWRRLRDLERAKPAVEPPE